jgi:uncharacterized protein (TIGR03437 family)
MLNRHAALLLVFSILPAAAADRITRPIDSRATSVLKGHVHPLAIPACDKGEVDPAFPVDYMMLMVRPSGQSNLDRLLLEQQNPSSPNFRQWLTPEQFGDRFGLSAGDHSRIVAWLKSEGFTINEQARGRNWIAFSGAASQVRHALHTSIHRFEVNGRQHFANATDPAVPAALADVVDGFLGLHDFNPQSGAHTALPDYTIGRTHYLVPEDFATIYNLKPLYDAGFDGTGQSIAIVGSSGLPLSDVRAFRTRYGLPANDPKLVPYAGALSTMNTEANLDVEWAGAVAPKATIYYVYGTSAFTALAFAVNLNIAPVISNSYYTCEGNASPLFYRSLGQQANAQGITILSASGDGGAAGCFDQFSQFATHGPLLQFPATLPEVTAVGGTQFAEGSDSYWSATNSPNMGSALSYIPETVWNESVPGISIAASAGGPSVMFSKPVWQTGPGVPDDNARDVPDISLTAAGHDAYYIVYNGSNLITYGTSASAPAMSGIIAILNQYQVAQGYQKKAGLGNMNPQLYRLAQAAPSAFHDITSGDNMVPCAQGTPGCLNGSYGYQAGPGYDMATGLGSVDGYSFVTQWNIPTNAVTVQVSADTTTPTLNDSVQVTATVAAASGSGAPTGNVDFTANMAALGSAPLVSNGPTSTAGITVPAWLLGGTGTFAIYAVYSGDAAFSSGGGAAVIRVSAPTGVSGVVPSVSNNPVWPASDSQGLAWQETVRLREAAGVPSILTGFTIDGQPQKLSQYFPSTAILPNTTVSSTPLVFRNLTTYPVTRKFGFTGVDSTGQTWSREIPVLFLAPLDTSGGFRPTLVPLTMTQNTAADPSCQWSQQLFLDETGGLGTSVFSLTQGGVVISDRIPTIFGTSRLAAWGSISGTLCWSGVTPGASSTVQVLLNNGLNQTLQVSFAGPPASPVQISAAPAMVSLLSAAADQAAKGTLAVNISDKSQTWTASIFPANRTTAWLSLSQLSGAGPAQVALQASGAGFEPGVYRATIVLESPNTTPSTVNVPVMFVLGGGGPAIARVANTASLKNAASPGMLVTITGSQLANSTNQSSGTPLRFLLDGVSVQVNGVAAPIKSISPQQIDVQIPYEAGAGPAVLGINNNGQIAGYQLQIAATAPAIFADGDGFIAGNTSANAGANATLYLTGDGDITTTLLSGFTPSTTTAPANLPKSRLPLSVTVGGQPAFLRFYGISPGLVGATQVNFIVPASLTAGVQAVVVTVGGVSSPPVNLTVTGP